MADKDLGSLYKVTRSAGVQHVWHEDDPAKGKITGKGVGVALIDSGIAPVKGLSRGKVVNGPDLSFESPGPATCATSTPSATAPTWPASSPGATRAQGRRPRPARASSPASPRTRTWST